MAYVYWIHLDNHTDYYNEGYIGVSTDHEKRFKDHIYLLENDRHENVHLTRAYKKYDKALVKSILFEGSENECYAYEFKLRSNKNIGWNIAEGGSAPPKMFNNTWNLNRKLTEEHKKKLSEKSHFKNYNKSDEHRKIASITMKGKPKSEEQKRKQSQSMLGKMCGDNNPSKREDVRLKISLAKKAYWAKKKGIV